MPKDQHRAQKTLDWIAAPRPPKHLTLRLQRDVELVMKELEWNGPGDGSRAMERLRKELVAQRRQSAWLLKVMRERDQREEELRLKRIAEEEATQSDPD